MGMVHRDVKPGNILVDADGNAKVTDFGLVKVMGSQAFNTQYAFGTPGYLAPEVEQLGKADRRSDIYSFGVLLYQMLTSEFPRGLWEPVSVIKPEMDERFDRVISRALKTKPKDRFQTMDELKSELDSIAFTTPDGRTRSSALSQKSLTLRLFAIFIGFFAVSAFVSVFDVYFNHTHLGGCWSRKTPGKEQALIR